MESVQVWEGDGKELPEDEFACLPRIIAITDNSEDKDIILALSIHLFDSAMNIIDIDKWREATKPQNMGIGEGKDLVVFDPRNRCACVLVNCLPHFGNITPILGKPLAEGNLVSLCCTRITPVLTG